MSIEDANGNVVADVYGPASNNPNARLIAAAPELLAALQKASDFLDYLDEWDDPNRVMRRYHDRKEEIAEALNSAIAKATTNS